jgi:aspartyl-tRNA(Asn)/glutamyl-tRNA(Gln) amidotransferase subunit A
MTISLGALELEASVEVVRASVPNHWGAGQEVVDEEATALPQGPPVAFRPPVEEASRALAAIAGSDTRWRAWVHIDAGGVQEAAQQAQERLELGGVPRPLEGVSVGVKDVIDVAGMPCAAGFGPFADRLPGRDSAVVSRLRRQGALIVGKTATTQFAFSDPAPTLNPWDEARTPGGSSSGSAVAVAVGHVPVTLGTQTSGSTIRPAAYTGVVGFKPSRGRLPMAGVLPLAWSLDEVGLFARNVADCQRVFAASVSAAPPRAAPPRAAALRMAVVDDAMERAAPEAARAVAALVDGVAAPGLEITALRLGVLDDVAAAHRVIMTAEIAAVHAGLFARHEEHYAPRIAMMVREALHVLGRDVVEGERLRSRVAHLVSAVFDDVDVLVLPSVVDVAPPRDTTGDRSLQLLASLLGLPAVTIPAGLSASGLPLGMQLIGRYHADEALLGVAAHLEAACPAELSPTD